MGLPSTFNNVSSYFGMWRQLTSGEIELAKSIFQDNIDYERVKLYRRRIWPNFAQDADRAVAYNNKTSFPGKAYSDDFSKEDNAVKKSVFIHELHHVWQHQNHALSIAKSYFKEMLTHQFNYQKAYLYFLDPNKDLLDYGFEQQAAMVQDYYLLKFHGMTSSYKHRRMNDERDPQKLEALYESVLKTFLNTTSPLYVSTYKGKNFGNVADLNAA